MKHKNDDANPARRHVCAASPACIERETVYRGSPSVNRMLSGRRVDGPRVVPSSDAARSLTSKVDFGCGPLLLEDRFGKKMGPSGFLFCLPPRFHAVFLERHRKSVKFMAVERDDQGRHRHPSRGEARQVEAMHCDAMRCESIRSDFHELFGKKSSCERLPCFNRLSKIARVLLRIAPVKLFFFFAT